MHKLFNHFTLKLDAEQGSEKNYNSVRQITVDSSRTTQFLSKFQLPVIFFF
jgi:hypothetical protein